MKRKKQIVLQIILILVFGVIIIVRSRVYTTPEKFLAANEMGLHYGPSDKILLKNEYTNGDLLIVGKIGDNALSIGEGTRKLFFFWGMPGGGYTGYREIAEDKDMFAEYIERTRNVVGLTNNENIAEIKFDLYYYSDYVATEIGTVDDDGFFIVNLDDGIFEKIEDEDDRYWLYVMNVEGLDKDGNVISTLY